MPMSSSTVRTLRALTLATFLPAFPFLIAYGASRRGWHFNHHFPFLGIYPLFWSSLFGFWQVYALNSDPVSISFNDGNRPSGGKRAVRVSAAGLVLSLLCTAGIALCSLLISPFTFGIVGRGAVNLTAVLGFVAIAAVVGWIGRREKKSDVMVALVDFFIGASLLAILVCTWITLPRSDDGDMVVLGTWGTVMMTTNFFIHGFFFLYTIYENLPFTFADAFLCPYCHHRPGTTPINEIGYSFLSQQEAGECSDGEESVKA